MKIRSKRARLFGSAAFCVVLAISGLAWANGEEFFDPAKDGSIDLVYFGHIKDQSGRVLDGANITIMVNNPSLLESFPAFKNDAPGHFRSEDFGAWIKTRGWDPVPEQTKIVVEVAGYEKATANVPRKVDGPVEVNFVMKKAGATATAGGPEENSGSRPWLLPTAVVGVILLSVVVVRTASRRRSTNDSGRASV